MHTQHESYTVSGTKQNLQYRKTPTLRTITVDHFSEEVQLQCCWFGNVTNMTRLEISLVSEMCKLLLGVVSKDIVPTK